MLVKECSVLLLYGDRGATYATPYVDSHGETDLGLVRTRAGLALKWPSCCFAWCKTRIAYL